MQWILDHRKSVLFCLIFVFTLLFLSGYFFHRLTSRESHTYRSVNEACAELFDSPTASSALLDRVVSALKKAPDLEEKLGGRVAQSFLSLHQIHRVLALSERGIKRIQELAPSHARFANNTLLIAQKEYAAALKEAKEFKAQLEQRKEERSTLLYQFNLLRIACLEMRLGHAKDEVESWRELMLEGERNPTSWTLLLRCFQKEDLSLLDFIDQRLKANLHPNSGS